MSQKEQNKPETKDKKYYKLIKDIGHSFTIGKVYEDRGDGWFWNDDGQSHGVSETILNEYFELVNAYVPERNFTEYEVISMLEALRQRCAEEIKLGDTVLKLKNKINKVEYRDLIPPLTKQ